MKVLECLTESTLCLVLGCHRATSERAQPSLIPAAFLSAEQVTLTPHWLSFCNYLINEEGPKVCVDDGSPLYGDYLQSKHSIKITGSS